MASENELLQFVLPTFSWILGAFFVPWIVHNSHAFSRFLPSVQYRNPSGGQAIRLAHAPAQRCFLLLCFVQGAWAAAPAYDNLIAQARAGKPHAALEFLRSQPMNTPDSARYISDWVEIAQWAGQDREAVEVYTRYANSVPMPTRAMAAAARAYRNVQQWGAAVSLLETVVAREPANAELQLALVMALADAGQDQKALPLAKQLLVQDPKNPQKLLALAYVHMRAGRLFDAKEQLSLARELAPRNAEVLQQNMALLPQLNMSYAALNMALAHPELVTRAQLRSLQAARGAELVGLAEIESRNERTRFDVSDRALAYYAPLLTAWRSDSEAGADLVRIRIDRLGALHTRFHMQALITEYEALLREGVPVPAYAKRWAASAYMYLRQPEQALVLYRELDTLPDRSEELRVQDAVSLIYALVETEQLDEAVALADQAAQNQGPTRYLEGAAPVENDLLMDAKVQAALVHSFAEDMPQAQQRMESMLEMAPGNQGLRTTLAGLYRARSQPRRSEISLKMAEALEPRNLGLQVQQGHTALALQEWRQMDALADDSIARFPENAQARRLDRLRDVHHMAELQVSGYRGRSSENPALGSRDYGVDTAVYTAPLAHDWRLFAGMGYGVGDFAEGRGRHRLGRAGLEWRVRDNTAEAEVSSHQFGHGTRTGARLAVNHDISDHWAVGLDLERLARSTPLRALHSNITANSAGASLRWRANERREWSLGVSGLDFSDGNRSTAVSLNGRERLYTRPHWNADLLLGLESNHNSQPGGPYFAPESDLMFSPVLSMNHVMYRRYETSWTQNVLLGFGAYAQKGYGTGGVATLGYGQRFRWNDVLEVGLTYSITRRPYDGKQERHQRLAFDLNYRF